MIIKLEVGMLETNCYIFVDDDTNEGMVIDPGDDAVKILDIITEKNINVKYIVLTHGHWDHIGVLDRIKVHTNAQVLIHNDDKGCLSDSEKSLAYMFGITSPVVNCDRILSDGEEIKVGNTVFKVIHTPGHSPGGICLLSGNILFSGDTLFRGTIGRTDFLGGDRDKIISSIKNKLIVLDPDIEVYPGHGGCTTIGKEKENIEKW